MIERGFIGAASKPMASMYSMMLQGPSSILMLYSTPAYFPINDDYDILYLLWTLPVQCSGRPLVIARK